MDFFVSSVAHITVGIILGTILNKVMIYIENKYNINNRIIVFIQILISIYILYLLEVKAPRIYKSKSKYFTPTILLSGFFIGVQSNVIHGLENLIYPELK